MSAHPSMRAISARTASVRGPSVRPWRLSAGAWIWAGVAAACVSCPMSLTGPIDLSAQQAAPASQRPTGGPDRARHHFVPHLKGKVYPRDLVTTEAKLTSAMTDGRYSFLDEVWKPGFVVVPHFHAEHAEAFYVIDGEVEWTVNGETHRMGAGDMVYIPPDTVHAVKVVGDRDLRTLMIYAPGGYEDVMDEEKEYTAEQRKQPDITAKLRANSDFHPSPMPASVPPTGDGETTPRPNRQQFALRGKGETFKVGTEVSEVKLSAAHTDGRYSLLDEIWRPDMAVPPHFHTRHAETFYIISGQVEWTVGGETRVLGAGDLVFIPPDTVHSVKVVGGKELHTLMLYDPGGYEHHSRREAQYTEQQRREPKTQQMLMEKNDFNPAGPTPGAGTSAPARP